MSRTIALSRDAVRRVRLAYFHRKDRTMQELAEHYGVAQSTIFKALHRHPPYHPKYRKEQS